MNVLGVERRRRWPYAAKLSILAEVNTNDWTLADVARRHDLTRLYLYQWRRELRAKGLLSDGDFTTFVPLELLPSADAQHPTACGNSLTEIAITLRNGRQLHCQEAIDDQALIRLLRILEVSR